MKHFVKVAALSIAMACGASAGYAVPLDPISAPAGLSYSGSYSLPSDSNCPTSAPSCVKLAANGNGTFKITADAGYTFDLTSFAFSFDGKGGNGLTVGYVAGTSGQFTVLEADYAQHTVHVYDLSPLPLSNLTMLSFTDVKGGTSLIGDIEITNVAAVPLPAAGLLLLGGLGGLGLLKRRRKTA